MTVRRPGFDTAHSLTPDHETTLLLLLAFGRRIQATPMPVAAGESAYGQAYALHDPAAPPAVLLRRYPPHQQAQAIRAAQVMNALRRLQFPVPRVLLLHWNHRTQYTLLLTDHIPGRRVGGAPHAFFVRVGTHFAYTLAELHALPWDTLADLPVTPLHYAFKELVRLVRRLQTWELQEILDWLLDHINHIEELPRTIVHGEYTLQHIIADPPHVAAVDGWENAVIADPRFDVGFASAMLGAYGEELSRQFIDAYLSATGELPGIPFWEVFSALRVLARVGRTLSTLHEEQRERFLENVLPYWQGLLAFVETRTGLELLWS